MQPITGLHSVVGRNVKGLRKSQSLRGRGATYPTGTTLITRRKHVKMFHVSTHIFNLIVSNEFGLRGTDLRGDLP